jgi:hypothetical protein
MGASLCVNKVALAQNLGLEYIRGCYTFLDRETVSDSATELWMVVCCHRGLMPAHFVPQILFLCTIFVKISKEYRLMTVRP